MKIQKKDGSVVPVHWFGPSVKKDSNLPAVIVLQEWWGVNDQIKKQAQDLANAGFECIVPDLYRGKLGLEVEEANHLMSNLNWVEALEDIQTCATYLKENGHRKVGVIGFCMGGALSLAVAAQKNTALDSAVCFYGIPSADLANVSNIHIPVQLHFGELDSLENFSDPKAVDTLLGQFNSSGVSYEIFRYAGQGHAFMNDTPWSFEKRKQMGLPPYDPTTVAIAWDRVKAFLHRTLSISSQL